MGTSVASLSAAVLLIRDGGFQGRDIRILYASDLCFDLHNQLEVMRRLATPERVLRTQRIEDCFSPHFFDTNFWAMCRTTFRFRTGTGLSS